MDQHPDDCIIGQRVRVTSCSARKHGDVAECVCRLLDRNVRIGKKRDTVPPTYEILGGKHYVTRGQVILLPKHRGAR